MQPIHLAIGAVEGCITAAVLAFLYEARPSLLWQGGVAAGEKQRLTLRGTLGVLAGAAVVVAGGLSLLASAFPDGLEWSLQRLTGSTELETTGPVPAFFARIQEWTACCRTTTLQAPTRLPEPARRASSARSWCWPW